MDRLELRRDGLEWRLVEGEVVILDVLSSLYFALNRTGAVLWTALAEGSTEEGLVRRLVMEFGVADEKANQDVLSFIEQLREHHMLSEG